MPVNHPYDARYNAKIYVPKLTEEQRRARATPLENLRRPKLRPADALPAPAPSVDAVPDPVPTPDAPSPSASAAPALVQAQDAPASCYGPTAREVVLAEFPDLAEQGRSMDVVGESDPHKHCIVRETCSVASPESGLGGPRFVPVVSNYHPPLCSRAPAQSLLCGKLCPRENLPTWQTSSVPGSVEKTRDGPERVAGLLRAGRVLFGSMHSAMAGTPAFRTVPSILAPSRDPVV